MVTQVPSPRPQPQALVDLMTCFWILVIFFLPRLVSGYFFFTRNKCLCPSRSDPNHSILSLIRPGPRQSVLLEVRSNATNLVLIWLRKQFSTHNPLQITKSLPKSNLNALEIRPEKWVIYRVVTSAQSCNKVGHLFWFTILAQHEVNDVILYIYNVYRRRSSFFKTWRL